MRAHTAVTAGVLFATAAALAAPPRRPDARIEVFEFPGVTLIGSKHFLMPWPEVWGRATLKVEGHGSLVIPGIKWRKTQQFDLEWSPDGQILAWRTRGGAWRYVYVGEGKRLFHGPPHLPSTHPISWEKIPPFQAVAAELLLRDKRQAEKAKLFAETESRGADAGLAEFLVETAAQEPDLRGDSPWTDAFGRLPPDKKAFVRDGLREALEAPGAPVLLAARLALHSEAVDEGLMTRFRAYLREANPPEDVRESTAVLLRRLIQVAPELAAEDGCRLLTETVVPAGWKTNEFLGLKWGTTAPVVNAAVLAVGASSRPCPGVERLLLSPDAACTPALQCEPKANVLGLKIPTLTLGVPPLCSREEMEEMFRKELNAHPAARGRLQYSALIYAAGLRKGWDTSAVELRNARRRYSVDGMPPNCEAAVHWAACNASLDAKTFEAPGGTRCPAADVTIHDSERRLFARPRTAK